MNGIRGLQITVTDILDTLALGMSEDDLPREFPDLRGGIRATLTFAAGRERRFAGQRPSALGVELGGMQLADGQNT